jgi:hypothetical protein
MLERFPIKSRLLLLAFLQPCGYIPSINEAAENVFRVRGVQDVPSVRPRSARYHSVYHPSQRGRQYMNFHPSAGSLKMLFGGSSALEWPVTESVHMQCPAFQADDQEGSCHHNNFRGLYQVSQLCKEASWCKSSKKCPATSSAVLTMLHLFGCSVFVAALMASATAEGMYEPLHHVSMSVTTYRNRLTRNSTTNRDTSRRDKHLLEQRPLQTTPIVTVSSMSRLIITHTRSSARPHTMVHKS